MRIIIVGAGELGRLLAATLCAERHDVVIVDSDSEELQRLTDKLDVMTVEGSCASIAVLKEAGAANAQALLAVSGDEAANIISCQLAARLGVKNTICRLYSSDCFSEADGIGPEQFGIWRSFSSPEESASKIEAVLDNPIVMERIRFSNKNAVMIVFELTRSSFLSGVRVKDIPCTDILKNIRFAAILRGKQFLIPHGDTILVPGDKVYAAGHVGNVDAFLQWISPDDTDKPRRIIISGSDDTGRILAMRVSEAGYDVRVIEKDERKGERLLDVIPSDTLLIHGDPTDEEVLEEAGISGTDVFISVDTDDEDNILSCLQAKRLGARKVISLTHKPEYVRIISAMDPIDCGFSATLVAVNTVLRLLEGGMLRVDALLQQFRATLSEFKVLKSSPLCGTPLCQVKLPASVVLALIFRDGEVLTPSGSTVLRENDTAVALVTPESVRELEPFFPRK